jgi:hypothetical protein
VMIRPEVQHPPRQLAAIVHEDPLRSPTLRHETIADANNILPRSFLPTSIASASRLKTSTIVNARKRSPLTSWSATKSMHQASFGRLGTKRSRRVTTILPTSRKLAAQLQALLRLESIHLRSPQLPALPSQQDMKASVAEADPSSSQLPHSLPKIDPRVPVADVPLRAPRQSNESAGPSLGDRIVATDGVHHRSPQRGPGHFFALTS